MSSLIVDQYDLKYNTLDKDDKIHFFVNGSFLKYHIYSFSDCVFLVNSENEFSNEKVFEELNIDKNLKGYICMYYYGYYPGAGVWPEAKKDDYEALTRLVIGLYDLIDAYNIGVRILYDD